LCSFNLCPIIRRTGESDPPIRIEIEGIWEEVKTSMVDAILDEKSKEVGPRFGGIEIKINLKIGMI